MSDPELDLLITRMRRELSGDVYDRVQPFMQVGTELLDGGQPLSARRVFEAILADVENLPHSKKRDQALSVAWFNIACTASRSGNAAEEMAIYERLRERFGNERDPYVRYILAMALVNRGVKLADAGKLEEAALAYGEIVTRFIDAPEPETRAQVAAALVYRGVTHGLLGRPEDELRDYDLAIELFGSDSNPVMRRPLAKALYSKAAAAGLRGRHDEALRIGDELMKRFSNDGDPEIQKVIAQMEESRRRLADAMMTVEAYRLRLAELIVRGDFEELSAFADTILVRCSDPADPVYGQLVSTAMLAPAMMLAKRGRLDEASGAVGAVIDRIGDRRVPATETELATALWDLARCFSEQKRVRECIEWCDRLLARSSDDTNVHIDVAVAAALCLKAESLAGIGQMAAAVEACAGALRRFPAPVEPRLRLFVGHARFYRAFLLSELDPRSREAIEELTEVCSRYGDDPEPDLRRVVFNALVNKRAILLRQRRLAEVVAVSEELIERFAGAAEEDIRLDVARVAFERIVHLRELGEHREALAACDAYARFAGAGHPNIRQSVPQVLLNKGVILRDLGRMHEAVQVCDEIIMGSAADADPALRSIIAIALRNKGNFLEELAWPLAAADVYTELAARFAMDDQPQILDQVTLARERLAVLRSREP